MTTTTATGARGRSTIDRNARARWEREVRRALEVLEVQGAPAALRRTATTVVEAQREVWQARAELERLEGKRDAAVIRARVAGLGRPECGTLAGISPDRVGQITRRAARAASPAGARPTDAEPELPLDA